MRPSITVCGLGPGGAGDLTEATVQAIERNGVRFLRTTRHPTADRAVGARSFDEIYNRSDELADVYQTIADELVEAAIADRSGDADGVVYIVPGSPLVLERSVAHLRADDRIDVELVPSLSFLDVAWARLQIDPVESRVRLIDGHTFSADAAGEVGPLLVAHTHAQWVLSDIKLAIDAGSEMKAIVLQGLGTDDERIVEVEWPDLDRVVEADHLTSLYLPEVAAPIARQLQRSIELVDRLRRDCPWDAKQTHETLRPYLIEETYEVVEAIDAIADAPDSLEAYTDLEEELGDLWFQILFHSQLATEQGAFTVGDVAATMHDKLVVRHPHVFGDVEANDADAVASNWELIKKDEKGRESVMDGIPTALPALMLAKKVLTKADRVGAPADPDWVASMLATQPTGSTDAAELGDRLLALVERSRLAGIDPETSLREAAMRAKDRFEVAEASEALTSRWIAG